MPLHSPRRGARRRVLSGQISFVGVLRGQFRQGLQQRRGLEMNGAVDVALHRGGVDPGDRGVERFVVVDLRIAVERLGGGVQQEGDVERVERYRLGRAA